MVVNSTLIKDDRRTLAIKELSGLLKDKKYNFDKECIDNLVNDLIRMYLADHHLPL